MSIKDAIFAVESMAHLQGKERELLPVVEAARAEHRKLVESLIVMTALTRIKYGNLDKDVYAKIQEAEALIALHQ